MTELALPSDHERRVEILRDNYAGFVTSADLTLEEKITALGNLVPMAFQVIDEARDTIERLRTENETFPQLLQVERRRVWSEGFTAGVAANYGTPARNPY